LPVLTAYTVVHYVLAANEAFAKCQKYATGTKYTYIICYENCNSMTTFTCLAYRSPISSYSLLVFSTAEVSPFDTIYSTQ